MKIMSFTLIMCFFATALSGSEMKEDDIRSKKACIVIFKQVLGDINNNKLDKAFTQIADGGGRTFKLITTKEIEHIRNEDGKDFLDKNFPNFDIIEKNFAKIEFSEVLLNEDHVKNKKWAGNSSKYSYLRFIKFKKEIYWVPFDSIWVGFHLGHSIWVGPKQFSIWVTFPFGSDQNNYNYNQ